MRDGGKLTEGDPLLFSLVRDLQAALESVGVRAALLHETPGTLEEHDVDLAIDGPWSLAWRALTSAAGEHGYRPLLLAEYDVGSSRYAVFARAKGAAVSRLAVDTCGDARGIGKFGVPMRRLLDHTIVRSEVRYPDPAWEAAYVLAKHVWKRRPSSPALDATAVRARAGTDAFERAARTVFGARLAGRLADRLRAGRPLTSEADLPVLLRGIHQRRALRSPLLPLRFARRWASRILRPSGTWVVLCGPDGSGKSTAASGLHGLLTPMFRRSLRLHGSPGILPRPGSLVGRAPRDPSRPHQADAHGIALSTLLLLYHWLDHSLGYVWRIRPVLVRSGAVVMERGYHDLAVDPRRYRLDVPEGLVRVLGRLLPRPDVTILLLADPAVLHGRKPELDLDEIDRQQERWRNLSPNLGAVAVIDAGGARDEVLAAVLDAVISARSNIIANPGRSVAR